MLIIHLHTHTHARAHTHIYILKHTSTHTNVLHSLYFVNIIGSAAAEDIDRKSGDGSSKCLPEEELTLLHDAWHRNQRQL